MLSWLPWLPWLPKSMIIGYNCPRLGSQKGSTQVGLLKLPVNLFLSGVTNIQGGPLTIPKYTRREKCTARQLIAELCLAFGSFIRVFQGQDNYCDPLSGYPKGDSILHVVESRVCQQHGCAMQDMQDMHGTQCPAQCIVSSHEQQIHTDVQILSTL